MPRQPIPFNDNEQSGLDALAGASPASHNVVTDAAGAIRRRPAIGTLERAYTGVVDANGIQAIRESHNGQLYAVGAPGAVPDTLKTIYRVKAGGAVALEEKLHGGQRAQITETEPLLVFADGGTMKKLELASDTVTDLGGSPPRASHVVAHQSRLIANDLDVTNRYWYSGIATGGATAGHEQWTLGVGNAGLQQAEARPDPVVAVAENTNELFVFGTTNTQVYSSDPSTVFAPVAAREYGCSAPYSIVRVDQMFGWVDQYRRIVLSDGRKFSVISDAIQKTLNDYGDISGCFGYRVRTGFVDCLVWTFPAQGVAHVFRGGQWSRWTSPGGLFKVSALWSSEDDGAQIVGTTDGRIGQLSLNAADDLGDPVLGDVYTGFLDFGTSRKKKVDQLYLQFRRGQQTTGGPHALLSWRDEPGAWVTPLKIDLGQAGDLDPVVSLPALGVFRTRQWRMQFTGTENFALVRAELNYTELGY